MVCIKRRFRYVKAFNVRIVFSSYTETYATFTCELSNFFIFWKIATENLNADKFTYCLFSFVKSCHQFGIN